MRACRCKTQEVGCFQVGAFGIAMVPVGALYFYLVSTVRLAVEKKKVLILGGEDV